MPTRDIVVIGASAGGVSALIELMQNLHGFPGTLLITLHVSLDSPGMLPSLLAKAGGFPAAFPKNGQPIQPGHIYVAPADYHLLIKHRRIELSHGPRENGFRPAVDPMFRTAARCFGRRVVGLLLSGGLDDGTDGLRIIKEFGGIAIAQDPQEAFLPSMPESAIRAGYVDHVATLKETAHLLRRYAGQKVSEDLAMCADLNRRPDVIETGDKAIRHAAALGPPSIFTCPDCGGSLWEFTAGHQLRYRCHVGHLYTGDGLVQLKDDHLEQALWSAVRAMEEAAALRLRMAERAQEKKWEKMALPYRRQAEQFRQRADLIRRVLLQGNQETKGRRRATKNPKSPRRKETA